MHTRASFERFFQEAAKGPTVFLELGVGFNSPGAIRHPFQRMTALWPDAALIRLDKDYLSVPDEIREKSAELSGDIGANLKAIAAMI